MNLDKLVAAQHSSMKNTINLIRYRLRAIELLFCKVPSERDALFCSRSIQKAANFK